MRFVSLTPKNEGWLFDCCEPRWRICQIALKCRRQTETCACTQRPIRRFDEVGEHVAIPDGSIKPAWGALAFERLQHDLPCQGS
jgi:hypothetical protein